MLQADDQNLGRLVGTIERGPFRALLEAALAHEQRGEGRAAAATWRTALQSIPRYLSPSLRPVLEHAKAAVDANDRALEAFLGERLGSVRARHGNARLDRFDRAQDILLRKRRVFRPQPSFMYVPGLPAIEFYDRDQFPWLDRLEAAKGDIRAELVQVLADGPSALEPYISVDGVP